MKIVAYIRTNNANKFSLEEQQAACKKYADEKMLVIDEYYTDFEELLKSNCSAVIVESIGRISRNKIELAMKKHALRHKGIEIILANTGEVIY